MSMWVDRGEVAEGSRVKRRWLDREGPGAEVMRQD